MSSLFNYASSIYHIYQAILTHFLSHFPQFLSFYILLCDFLYFFCPFGVRCNVRYVSKQVLLFQSLLQSVLLLFCVHLASFIWVPVTLYLRTYICWRLLCLAPRSKQKLLASSVNCVIFWLVRCASGELVLVG